jgi:integrase/recombinase XerC
MTEQPLIISNEARPSELVSVQPLGTVIREYIRTYASAGTHTARAKQLDTDRFLNFLCKIKRTSDVEQLKVADWDFSATQRFVDESLRIGEAPATVSRRLATLKHIGRVLSEKIPGFINPAREVRPPKQQATRPKSIDEEELAQIRVRARERGKDGSSFIAARNETILALLLDTGLRADEVRTLRLSQISSDLEWIEQVRTKGRRFRRVYITQEMRPKIKNYLARREEYLKRSLPNLTPVLSAKLPLFVSAFKADPKNLRSYEMGAKSIWRAIRSYSVDTRLHPHLLRHTYATELLDESRDIRLVAQALGHSDVRVTMRYTERGDEEVANALERTRAKRGAGGKVK